MKTPRNGSLFGGRSPKSPPHDVVVDELDGLHDAVIANGLMLICGKDDRLSLYAVAAGRARPLTASTDAVAVWRILDALDVAHAASRPPEGQHPAPSREPVKLHTGRGARWRLGVARATALPGAPVLTGGRATSFMRRHAWAVPWRRQQHTIRLASGVLVKVRPIRPRDKPALVEAFGQLDTNPDSPCLAGRARSLDDRVLAYLTEVDHRDHCALVALEPDNERVIALARYVRRPDLAASADVSISVVADWQPHGIGEAMLTLLIERAAQCGFDRLRASVLATNRPILTLLRSHGFLATCDHSQSDIVDLERS